MTADVFNTVEILPSNENILNAFTKDSVNRVRYVFSMYEMINRKEFPFSSVSLDGPWGSGKTFFIKMLMMLIRTKSDEPGYEDYKVILDAKERQFCKRNSKNLIYPIYFDAWKNDSATDPLLSLLYTMCKDTGITHLNDPQIETVVKSILKTTLKFSLKTASIIPGTPDYSDLVDSVCESFKTDSPFGPVIDAERLSQDLDSLLNKLVERIGKPIVVFIDELDRCSPTFAIKLLESVKHYFSNNKILFVFSVNILELQHSIQCVYGQNFNSTRYLDRFFNIRFNLPVVETADFLRKEFSCDTFSDSVSHIIVTLSELFNLQLRELVKFNDLVRFINESANYIVQRNYSNGYEFIHKFFIPIALALKFTDPNKFQLFITGKGHEILNKVFFHNYIKKFCSFYLKSDEQLSDSELLNRLNESYNALFYYSDKNVEIGQCIFYRDCYEIFKSKVGFFS